MGGIGKLYPAQFFIAMFLKNLIVGCIFLVVAGSATSRDASPSGVLERHLKILSPKAVDIGDENAATVTAEDYAEYPLIILSRDEKKEIARITADTNGNYRVVLPPGDYILDVQGRARRHARWKPKPFTVVSNQTVRVDMDIDTDHWRVRSTQPSRQD
jgi:hypothetical protein